MYSTNGVVLVYSTDGVVLVYSTDGVVFFALLCNGFRNIAIQQIQQSYKTKVMHYSRFMQHHIRRTELPGDGLQTEGQRQTFTSAVYGGRQ